ncbi:max-like protein X isoform X3 [Brachionichthys hirsutus]|uniref:max-like protein X isoform X3 n=1 Tax=Brachionichthys hirsutus TaxID=412623 RepID=UPI0036052771
MTDPAASPEDYWKQTDGAFSDSGFDPGFFAETPKKETVVSRTNSIGSTSASSVPNTDDEDSDYRHETYKDSYKDRRRQAHTQSEQKRRDAIKKGYDDLQSIVPTCQQQSEFAVGAQKISKATVLQKTIDYIHFLHKEKKKQEEDVSVLRKEVLALKIMKSNYEHIVRAHQNNPQQGEDQVSDQLPGTLRLRVQLDRGALQAADAEGVRRQSAPAAQRAAVLMRRNSQEVDFGLSLTSQGGV